MVAAHVSLVAERVDVPSDGLGGDGKGLRQGLDGDKSLGLYHVADFFVTDADRCGFRLFFVRCHAGEFSGHAKAGERRLFLAVFSLMKKLFYSVRMRTFMDDRKPSLWYFLGYE